MLAVKVIPEHMVEIGHDTDGKCHTQPNDVDQCKDLVLVKVTQGNQEVISKHTVRISIQRKPLQFEEVLLIT
jgi:hypothetical protein